MQDRENCFFRREYPRLLRPGRPERLQVDVEGPEHPGKLLLRYGADDLVKRNRVKAGFLPKCVLYCFPPFKWPVARNDPQVRHVLGLVAAEMAAILLARMFCQLSTRPRTGSTSTSPTREATSFTRSTFRSSFSPLESVSQSWAYESDRRTRPSSSLKPPRRSPSFRDMNNLSTNAAKPGSSSTNRSRSSEYLW